MNGNQDEKKLTDEDAKTERSNIESDTSTKVTFPWLMFFVASFFDLIGLIPLINIFTETLAGLIIGFWQKHYSPKTDPVLSFFLGKIGDAISFGILPSNIAIVIYAYWRKKTLAKLGFAS